MWTGLDAECQTSLSKTDPPLANSTHDSNTSTLPTLASQLSSWLPKVQAQLTDTARSSQQAAAKVPACEAAKLVRLFRSEKWIRTARKKVCLHSDCQSLKYVQMCFVCRATFCSQVMSLVTSELCFAVLLLSRIHCKQIGLKLCTTFCLQVMALVTSELCFAGLLLSNNQQHHTLSSSATPTWTLPTLSLLCGLSFPQTTTLSSTDPPAHTPSDTDTADSPAHTPLDTAHMAKHFTVLRLHNMGLLACSDSGSSAESVLSGASASSGTSLEEGRRTLKLDVFQKCTEELQWVGSDSSSEGIEALLTVLQATVPLCLFPPTTSTPAEAAASAHVSCEKGSVQREGASATEEGGESKSAQKGSESAQENEGDTQLAVEMVTSLLQQLPALTASSARRGLSDAAIARVMRLFFHPAYMRDR